MIQFKKIIKPDDVAKKGITGAKYVRLDFNSLAMSSALAAELNLQPKKTFTDVALFDYKNNEVYGLVINGSTDGFLLKGNEKNIAITSCNLATIIAKHYNLETIIDPKSDFKHHRFEIEIIEVDAAKVIVLLPPKKYRE